MAQVIISWVAEAGAVAVVNCDIAVARGGSRCVTRCCGCCESAVGQPGSRCHHFGAVAHCFEARNEVVMTIVDDVDSIDGGCA